MENIREHEEEMEIDLLELFHVLLQRWWLIALCAVVGAVAAFGVTWGLITPLYESKSMLYILNKTTTVTSLADIQMGSELTADFEVIATSKPVLDGAVKRIEEEEGLEFTRQQVKDMLQVSNQSGTRILVITATDPNPEYACVVANAVAKETAEQMANIMKSDPPTTVEKAEVSSAPVSPSYVKNIAIGFLLGLVVCCGILILRHILNDNIKTEDDVERYLGLPVLASVPYNKERERSLAENKRQIKQQIRQSKEAQHGK